MSIPDSLVEVLLIVPLALMGLWSLYRFGQALTFISIKSSGEVLRVPGKIRENELPFVTIQICCYNESKVIRSTIDAACQQNWPADRFEVHILDDSTDNCKIINDKAAVYWRARGINCKVIRRPNRIGYKAGNLQHALGKANGDFVACFDGDQRAHPDFLKYCMPFFFFENGEQDWELGMVQCPWSFYNGTENLLTRVQSLSLDVHFTIEQFVRSSSEGMFSFNGTGGIWRRDAIHAGGGWQWDTITEDLDLSYRAHLKGGYYFYFAPDITNALEVPNNYRALRSQRNRWCKGYSQVLRKSLIDLLLMPSSSSLKLQIFVHLFDNIPYVLLLWLFLISPIAFWCDVFLDVFKYAMLLIGSLEVFRCCVVIAFTVSCKEQYKGSQVLDRFGEIVLLFIILPGSCLFLTYAFFEGLLSRDATFIRTPKYGGKAGDELPEDQIVPKKSKRRTGMVQRNPVSWISIWEMAMASYYLYFGYWVVIDIHDRDLAGAISVATFSLILAFSFSLYALDEFKELVFRILVGIGYLLYTPFRTVSKKRCCSETNGHNGDCQMSMMKPSERDIANKEIMKGAALELIDALRKSGAMIDESNFRSLIASSKYLDPSVADLLKQKGQSNLMLEDKDGKDEIDTEEITKKNADNNANNSNAVVSPLAEHV